MKTYTIRAKLHNNKRIYRDIIVPEDILLYDLAMAIVFSFDFDFDHLFAFGNNPNSFYNSTIQYELDHDDCEEEHKDMKRKSKVEITPISEVKFFSKIKDKMSFIFDFGQDWLFELELRDFGQKSHNIKYPLTLKVNGESPEQYPEYD